MTFDPAKPRYTFPFNGKEYDIEGTFQLIADIEYALKDDIFAIANRVVERLSVSDTAKLLLAILGDRLAPKEQKEIGATLFNMGIDSEEFAMLRMHLFALLRITLAPPKDREERAQKMGELLGKR